MLKLNEERMFDVLIFDLHPKYELTLSIKTALFKSFITVWNWEINCSWAGAPQSRNRKVYVSVRKSFLKGQDSPKTAPMSLNHFQLPSVLSDALQLPSEEDFPHGHLSLVDPKLDNIHDPIPIGKLSVVKDGAAKSQSEFGDNNIRVYSVNGVSFPLGELFSPPGHGRAAIYDYRYQKTRPLSSTGRWLISGGTIAGYPSQPLAAKNFGALSPTPIQENSPPRYQVSLFEGLINYSSNQLIEIRNGGFESQLASPLSVGKGRKGKNEGDAANRLFRISKTLVYIRRHGSEQSGLEPDAQGFFRFSALYDLNETLQKIHAGESGVMTLAESKDGDKCRLDAHWEDALLYVRTFQGHIRSSVVQVESDPSNKLLESPCYMIHGTNPKAISGILRHGLKKMNRNAIHLVPEKLNARQGLYIQRSKTPFAVLADAGAASREGIKFYETENSITLRDGGPAEVIDAKFLVALYDFDLSDPQVGFNRLSIQAAKDGVRPVPLAPDYNDDIPNPGPIGFEYEVMTKSQRTPIENTSAQEPSSSSGHQPSAISSNRVIPDKPNYGPNSFVGKSVDGDKPFPTLTFKQYVGPPTRPKLQSGKSNSPHAFSPPRRHRAPPEAKNGLIQARAPKLPPPNAPKKPVKG